MEIVNFTTFQNKDILKIWLNNFVFQKKKNDMFTALQHN